MFFSPNEVLLQCYRIRVCLKRNTVEQCPIFQFVRCDYIIKIRIHFELVTYPGLPWSISSGHQTERLSVHNQLKHYHYPHVSSEKHQTHSHLDISNYPWIPLSEKNTKSHKNKDIDNVYIIKEISHVRKNIGRNNINTLTIVMSG